MRNVPREPASMRSTNTPAEPARKRMLLPAWFVLKTRLRSTSLLLVEASNWPLARLALSSRSPLLRRRSSLAAVPSSVLVEVIVAVLAALRRSMRPAVLITSLAAVAVPLRLRIVPLALV